MERMQQVLTVRADGQLPASAMPVFGRRIIFVVATLGALGVSAPAFGQSYVAATWSDTAVHRLDQNLNDIISFPAGAVMPNGIATDGSSMIWTGHAATDEVIAYDFNGDMLFSWPLTAGGGLQGMEYISDQEMAVMDEADVDIDFYHPITGEYIRTIPVAGSSVEGIAWDGTWLWQLETGEIHATDVLTGDIAFSIPNAAADCLFEGTGIASSGPAELTLACADGSWFKVSSVDGSVIASGNNRLDMYGLNHLPAVGMIPVPGYPKWSQHPHGLGQGYNVISDLDWPRLVNSEPGTPGPGPNDVVADDFISDGRPINWVRWWGAYFDPAFQPGGGPLSAPSPSPQPPDASDDLDQFETTRQWAAHRTAVQQPDRSDTEELSPQPPSGGRTAFGICPGSGGCCVENGSVGCDDTCNGEDCSGCCDMICNIDPFCCDTAWDEICADEACGLTGLCAPLCPGEGSCYEANRSPGCDDPACCVLICDPEFDPFCCDTEWDGICAGNAFSLCAGHDIDGWLLSFHSAAPELDEPDALLGLYFCAAEDVQLQPTGVVGADQRTVFEYVTDLSNCCLEHSLPDPRDGSVPAQEGAFYETANLTYWLDIQAVVGHTFQTVGDACDSPGVCGTFDTCGVGGPLGLCVCWTDPDGQAFCTPDRTCTELVACGPQGECPAGSRCAVDTCCTTPSDDICLPLLPCEEEISAPGPIAGSGLTASGRIIKPQDISDAHDQSYITVERADNSKSLSSVVDDFTLRGQTIAVDAHAAVPASGTVRRIQGAGLLFFDDPDALEDYAVNQQKMFKGVEDYEASVLPRGGIEEIDDPLAFGVPDGNAYPNGTAGLPNLRTQSNFEHSWQVPTPRGIEGLAAIAAGYTQNVSDIVLANYSVDSLDLLFTSYDKTAVGFYPVNILGSQTVEIKIFSTANRLLGEVVAPSDVEGSQFFGVFSPQPIGRINLHNPFDGFEGADNVATYTAELGQCLEDDTPNRADSPFWGWRTSAIPWNDDSTSGELLMELFGEWFYQSWQVVDGSGFGLDRVDNAFQLISKFSSCPWDCDGSGDGEVAVEDLLTLISQWGTADTCDSDFNGEVEVEDLLALISHWGFCVDCFCPASASAEGETCGSSINNGCNDEPPVFTSAACGDVFCGSAWAEGGSRDTDWYLVDLPDPDGDGMGVLSGTLGSRFQGASIIVDGIATCTPVVAGDIGCSVDCTSIQVASAILPAPGTYAVFVATGNCNGSGVFDGYPCTPKPQNEYVLQIDCDSVGLDAPPNNYPPPAPPTVSISDVADN